MFYSSKRYGHSEGFSCAFRQWRADSHCNKLHGYALAFKFVFASSTLDVRNWCVDFGGMKDLKQALRDAFDHKTVVAYDDPHIEWFRQGHALGTLDLVELPAVGCEKFAELAHSIAKHWLHDQGLTSISIVSVEVAEHEANYAGYSEAA